MCVCVLAMSSSRVGRWLVQLLLGWVANTEQIGADLEPLLFDLSSSPSTRWHLPPLPLRMAQAELAWPQPACQLSSSSSSSSSLLLSFTLGYPPPLPSSTMPYLFPRGCKFTRASLITPGVFKFAQEKGTPYVHLDV